MKLTIFSMELGASLKLSMQDNNKRKKAGGEIED